MALGRIVVDVEEAFAGVGVARVPLIENVGERFAHRTARQDQVLFGIEPGLDLAEDRHTSYLAQVTAFVVAAVSIRLQKTLLIPQPVGRIGPRPVGRVIVDNVRMDRVASIGPDAAATALPFARHLDWHAGVVGVDHARKPRARSSAPPADARVRLLPQARRTSYCEPHAATAAR